MKTSKKFGFVCLCTFSGVVATIVSVFVFFRFVHPVLAYAFTPPFSYHSNIKHYTSQQYVEFEDGEQFRDFTESLEFLDDGEIIAFFHADYWMRDNPFEGKASDYFMLDLYFESTEYMRIRKILETESGYNDPIRCGDYWCYRWHDDNNAIACVIAYRDEDQIIRVCMVTNRESEISTGALKRDSPRWYVD